ncbi:MAG: hypothetical protein ACM3X9_01585 [Bacillota bacterium]
MKKCRHFLILLFIGLVWGLGVVYAAEPGPDIEIRLINPGTITAAPGQVMTFSLLVINHSQVSAGFFEQLNLPADWQLLIPTSSFTIDPRAQEVRLLTVMIPATCRAGSYQINYTITGQDAGHNAYNSSITVDVSTVISLRMLIEDKPQVVAAGGKYALKLRYINNGNSRQTITFDVQSTPAFPLEVKPSELSLLPGESQILTISIQTNSNITSNIVQTVIVKAVAKDSGATLAEDTILVDIISPVTAMFDRYYYIPGRVKIVTGLQKPIDSGSAIPDLQVDFSGSGSIGETDNKVAFHLLTPNLAGETTGENKENWQLTYSNPVLNANLGNQSLALSPLTRRWDNYYHFNLDYTVDHYSLGIIRPEDNSINLRTDEWGIFYCYLLNPAVKVRVNYLNWSAAGEPNTIYSWQSEFKTNSDTTLNLEYGVNLHRNNTDNANAYYAKLAKQSPNSLNYSLETIYAAPDYYGNYTDQSSTSGMVYFPLSKKAQTSFSFHLYRSNLDLNPDKDGAYDDQTFNANLAYNLSPQAALVFSYESLRRKNQLPAAGYFTQDQLFKTSLQYQYLKWRFVPSVTGGKYEDMLADISAVGYLVYGFTLNYAPTSKQSYLLYLNVGDSNYTATPNGNNKVGVSASLLLKNNLNLNLEYQKNYLFSDITESSNYFTLNLSCNTDRFAYQINGSQTSNSGSEDYSCSFLTTYTVPWRVPVAKRSDFGTLKGKVYNAALPGNPPIANVILRTNGVSAVTNQKGEFSFTGIAPGVYSISIDKSLIGLNLAPLEEYPLVVEVKQGETKYLEIAMAPAGRITGRTVLTPAEQTQSGSIVVDNNALFIVKEGKDSSNPAVSPVEVKKVQDLAGTIVELSDGQETFRQVTDDNGGFSFEGIRPGKWVLRVYDNTLPDHYYFEQSEFEIALRPDETKEVIFKAVPQIRTIQIIDEGKL